MSAKAPNLHVCKNPACGLGSRKELGRFTGGITAMQKHLLTGDPVESLEEGVDYGEGFCPNCGEPGEPYDPAKAAEGAIAEAERLHQARLDAIKKGLI